MQFSPGIYEHAAALLGRSPWEVSRDGHLLAKAHQAAWERYRHPLIVVGIDVYNVEAEAYGAGVPEPRGNNMPSISSHPCQEAEALREVGLLQPGEHPRIGEVLEAGCRLRDNCPGAEVRIPVCGPFALAIGLMGMNELLMALVEERDVLREGLRHLLSGQFNYMKAIRECGLRPVFFESGTTPPLLPVEAFTDLEAPLLKELLERSRELFGESSPCIIGGDAAGIARPLMETGPGFVIAPSESDRRAFIEASREFPDIHVRVNIPSAILLSTSFTPVMTVAQEALDIAATRPNSSVGCGVVPFEADPAMILHLKRYIENKPTTTPISDR
ncbi:MAG: uroporphyrinogen decarboxylase family protein [Oceanipulchritudo sp.]